MKRVLTVGLTYTGAPIDGVEIENLGLCQAGVEPDRAAFPLYEYDVIIINPQSFRTFCSDGQGRIRSRRTSLGCLNARTTDMTSIQRSMPRTGETK